MSIEPPGTPSDNAPAETPSVPTPQEEHGWSPVAPPPGPPEPSAYAPPPAGPPAYYAPPASTVAAPRSGRGGLLAIVLVIVVLIVGGGGYAVAGFATANSKLNSSTDAYNKVTDDQNKLTDFFNNLSSQFDKNNLTTTSSVDSVKQEKTLLGQLVSQSQSSQPTVTADDQKLADADAGLSGSAWLTAFSRSSLDRQSTKIEDLRAGLKIAQTILADYVNYGTFYETLDDAVIDIDTMSTALDNHDLNGANAAVQKLKTDLGKAQTADVSGAGISTQMSGFVTTMQAFATDFANLLSAAQAGNSAGVNAAASAIDADSSKLDKFDEAAIATEEQKFYKNLIDSYNAAVDKANKA